MIDFIITWVDGNDPNWKNQYEKYACLCFGDKRSVRYRDWENLRYWFRGVEQFAPWVRNIYFVTEGHLPDWLNVKSPKLVVVRHEDFIPKEYLPLFNSRAIEVNLHNIPGLSDKFVYFNDDFFIINKISDSFFFKNDKPCDMAVLNAISGDGVSDAILEELTILNKHFNKKKVLKSNLRGWFNLKYKLFLYRTIALLPWPNFTGFYDPHLPSPFLKSTFIKVWEQEPAILEHTSKSKFRTYGTVNPYFFRYWQLLSGAFYPKNVYNDSVYFQMSDDNIADAEKVIQNQKKCIIALNDSDQIKHFESVKQRIIDSFSLILPNKSVYEN